MKTWKILDWSNRPEGIPEGEPIPLMCPNCGNDAGLRTAGVIDSPIIAITGMDIVFDPPAYEPPGYWLPKRIQCRECRLIYFSKKEASQEEKF